MPFGQENTNTVAATQTSTRLGADADQPQQVVLVLKDGEFVPVSLHLSENESIPVSVVLDEGQNLPIAVQVQDGQEFPVLLSESSVEAIATAIRSTEQPPSSVDLGIVNSCSVLLLVVAFAVLGALIVQPLLKALRTYG